MWVVIRHTMQYNLNVYVFGLQFCAYVVGFTIVSRAAVKGVHLSQQLQLYLAHKKLVIKYYKVAS